MKSLFFESWGGMDAEWELYILLCGDGTYYTGIARDADKRLEMHMGGKGAKYTRGRGPLRLVYRECCQDHSQALRRELEVKKLTRPQKEALINSMAPRSEKTTVGKRLGSHKNR